MNSEQSRVLKLYKDKLIKERIDIDGLFIYTFNFISEENGTVEIIDLNSKRAYNGLFMLHLQQDYSVRITMESFDNDFTNPVTMKKASTLYFEIDDFIERLTKELILPQNL
ncbi:MAG TPA: hypothetical protein VIM16_21390 [Mucilaginibacter sp.]|jgi:hypothetical protein